MDAYCPMEDYELTKQLIRCLDCDPNREKESTMERYMGNNKPTFKIGGKGVYKPGTY
jgi:hypothetical protein